MKKIFKVAGIEIRDDKFLMVRKAGKDIWTNLGGKPEKDESNEQALFREIKEELNCDAKIIKYLGEIENKAALDDAIIHLSVYVVELIGNPKIHDKELEEFGYISKDYEQKGIKLPLSVSQQIIPLLNKEKFISWGAK